MLTEKNIVQSELVLNYAVSPKSGSPLILLHGVTRRWQTFLPLIGAFANRKQIFALDFRGHGLSSNAEGAYLVIDYVDDIITFIKNIDEPLTIYGHSLGALVAAAVARAAPEQVSAVILEDPPIRMMGEKISETLLHSFFTGMQNFAGDQRAVNEITKDLSEMRLRNPQNKKELLLGDLRDRVSLRFTASCLGHLDPALLTPIVEGRWLTGYEVESTFRQICCPILLIQADSEVGGMLTDKDAAQIELWSKNVTRIKVPGVGHLVHWSATQQLINLVLGFLEST